jgi:hypothetical protein
MSQTVLQSVIASEIHSAPIWALLLNFLVKLVAESSNPSLSFDSKPLSVSWSCGWPSLYGICMYVLLVKE